MTLYMKIPDKSLSGIFFDDIREYKKIKLYFSSKNKERIKPI